MLAGLLLCKGLSQETSQGPGKSEEVGYPILGRVLPEGQKPAQRSQSASVCGDEEAESVG